MVKKYKTKVANVTAIQFIFDVLKELYEFLNYRDITYNIKSRILSGIITLPDGSKRAVNKNDYVVKYSNGTIEVYSPEEFNKIFVETTTSATTEV